MLEAIGCGGRGMSAHRLRLVARFRFKRKENTMKATKGIAIGLVLVLGMNCVAKASETGCRKADDISAGEYHTMVLMPDGRGRAWAARTISHQ